MQNSEQGFSDHQPSQITGKIKFGLRCRILANSKVSYMKDKGINIKNKL